nr:immunoglobulin light chain junction region [Macaca mulatta]MOW27822.1 immunoglobulin light chain junction region [Macaca mulatta]MOW27879.1 immunoglobulin light chain junction region [Macaca mulatta]MOW28075.1 immunoglobulin light chain junction region [Macaca mulatta]MOW28107.1 immunoglobulin light chain junction region [Macaca mulatta]
DYYCTFYMGSGIWVF